MAQLNPPVRYHHHHHLHTSVEYEFNILFVLPAHLLLSFLLLQLFAKSVSWLSSRSRCSWNTWRLITNPEKCLMSARFLNCLHFQVIVWLDARREIESDIVLMFPQVCNYRSSFFSDVESHFRFVHENTKDLLCPFCLKVLRTSHIYMQHFMKHQVCCSFQMDSCKDDKTSLKVSFQRCYLD